MTFLNAAIEVLRGTDKPLSVAEITRLALEHGLIENMGNTPRQTMAAVISNNMRKSAEEGKLSPFYRVERGRYRLRMVDDPLPEDYLENQIFERFGDFLTYREAAYEMLRSEGRPMKAAEIAQLAIERELINPQSMTPESSLSAQLYRDLQQHGAASVFRREGAGIFGLAEWEQDVDAIAQMAYQQRQNVKQQLRNVVAHMDPYAFEHLVGRLLSKMGYNNILVTRRASDEGIDVVADVAVGIMQVRTAIQVKRVAANVGRPVVSQFRGDMLAMEDIDQGMVITTAGFSKGAQDVARVPNTIPIILIDGDQLSNLLIEHRIGVRVEQVEVVSFDSDSLTIDEINAG
jgi:restriction system protein